ncbi:MAG: DsrE/DsrF/DrsH-like family protein [Solirubrobacteraceae bacterium]
MARAELEAFITDLILRREAETPDPNTITLIAWDGDLDRIWPTTILATTAAAGGMDVAVFFTFWGLSRSCARRSG